MKPYGTIRKAGGGKMTKLPYLKYTKDFRRSYITDFGGIVSGAAAEEGGMYDALNMSDYNAPSLSVRLGFAGVSLKDENGDAVLINEDILSMASDSRGGLVLCGKTKLWYYEANDGYWREFELGVNLNGEQKITEVQSGYSQGGDALSASYVYRHYMILPAHVCFCVWGKLNSAGDIAAPKYGVFKLSDIKITNYYFNASGYYGRGGKVGTSGAAIVDLSKSEHSVISSKGSLSVPPGFEVKVKWTPYSDGVGTAKENTGLVWYAASGEATFTNTAAQGGDTVTFDTLVFSDKNTGAAPFRTVAMSEYSELFSYNGKVDISFLVPKTIKGAFVHANRIWAWDETNIYASALGAHWNFTPNGTDAGGWSAPVVSGEKVTAGISYGGRPVFFTANSVITVYGDYPSAYSFSVRNAEGISEDKKDSLCECAGYLFYLSHGGIMRYGGSAPVRISDLQGNISYTGGIGGADVGCYYLYAKYLKSPPDTSGAKLYSYNVYTGALNVIEYTGSLNLLSDGQNKIVSPVFCRAFDADGAFLCVVMFNNNAQLRSLYCLPSEKRQRLICGAAAPDTYFGYNDSYKWAARFGRFFCRSPDIKGIKQIQLRARLLSPPAVRGAKRVAALYVKLCYDDADANADGRDIEDDCGFECVHTESVEMDAENPPLCGEEYRVRNIFIPVWPRRFDNVKLELSGMGRWEISSLSFEYYVGSERSR